MCRATAFAISSSESLLCFSECNTSFCISKLVVIALSAPLRFVCRLAEAWRTLLKHRGRPPHGFEPEETSAYRSPQVSHTTAVIAYDDHGVGPDSKNRSGRSFTNLWSLSLRLSLLTPGIPGRQAQEGCVPKCWRALFLEVERQSADALNVEIHIHLDTVGDLDEGDAARHAVLPSVERHLSFDLGCGTPLAGGRRS